MQRGKGLVLSVGGPSCSLSEGGLSPSQQSYHRAKSLVSTHPATMAENPEEAPTSMSGPPQPLTEENQRALQLVQSLVKDTMRVMVSDATRELREVVDQHLVIQVAPASTTSNGMLPVCSRGGVASLPSGGLLPPTIAQSGMPVILAVPTAGPAGSSSLTPIMSLGSPPALHGT